MIKYFGCFRKSFKGKDSHYYSRYKNLSSHEICSFFFVLLLFKALRKEKHKMKPKALM